MVYVIRKTRRKSAQQGDSSAVTEEWPRQFDPDLRGPDGVGKRQFALSLAKAVNCQRLLPALMRRIVATNVPCAGA